MIVEILKANQHIEQWQGLLKGEDNGKTIFEITEEEYKHFIRNDIYYKVKSKKLFFDEAYKNKIEAQKEANNKAQKKLNFRIELCGLKEQKEKFSKYGIVTEELEIKISELEEKIKAADGEPYINEEVEGKDEI